MAGLPFLRQGKKARPSSVRGSLVQVRQSPASLAAAARLRVLRVPACHQQHNSAEYQKQINGLSFAVHDLFLSAAQDRGPGKGELRNGSS